MYCHEKEGEYYSLKKSNMMEEEYECNFVELEKYALGLGEDSQVRKFIRGVRDHIRDRVKT